MVDEVVGGRAAEVGQLLVVMEGEGRALGCLAVAEVAGGPAAERLELSRLCGGYGVQVKAQSVVGVGGEDAPMDASQYAARRFVERDADLGQSCRGAGLGCPVRRLPRSAVTGRRAALS